MKFLTNTVAALALVGSVSAFSTSAPRSSTTAMKAATMDQVQFKEPTPAIAENTEVLEALMEAEDAVPAWKQNPVKRVQPGRYDDKDESIALPFLKRPTQLDGSHAGDFGFDPLGLTEPGTGFDLYVMQESELRHGRLAMLAAAGFPLSELVAPDWMLQENGCAPSVLNGFNPVTFVATALFFAAAGLFEFKTSLRRVDNTRLGRIHKDDMELVWERGVAGDYNFDPLDLYMSLGDSAVGRKGMRDVEVSHGRSAMLGITGMAAWEALTGHAVTESFSMFFTPNLLLPALGAAYVVATNLYEVEEEVSDRYLKLKVSSEGEARIENFNREMANMQEANKGLTESLGVVGDKIADLAGKGFELAKEKYEQVNEEYTEQIMKDFKQ
ncbi:I chlorophyll a/b-binding protein [Seminavis robusta]|uniref:I chlorophyll a/b-binding protein n=1 Tax=Seminavis robusta TaxID=568900 RepID=A0A9N8DGC9_9STRA|nr:I chlorophyll a/b-binding protein [Seminavis robusta]|eukprot:Sro74_g040880.1 I chlorophyll a/b-binding protein (384) ;mRNA; r:95580-96880